MEQPPPDRFQFRLLHLFILTTGIAIVMGIAVQVISPELFKATVTGAPTLFLLVVAAYATFFGGWLVLRGPRVFMQWKRLRRRKSEIDSKRADLVLLASQRLRESEANHPQATQQAEPS